MMTFEDFFAKKRIDISLLQANEHSLYEEFRLHYAQMGEKSFDHTKKFWFNNLRKKYLLLEEETDTKPSGQTKSEADGSHAASPETVYNPAGFKKSTSAAAKDAAANDQEKAVSDTIQPKPAFKSRFKANVKEKETENNESGTTKPLDLADNTTETPASKPAGFKPRFKAGVTKPADEQPQAPKREELKEEHNATETPASKPAGFKPRFKAGITKPADEQPQTPKREEPKEEHNATETPASKPSGFKPRFKAGVTKPADEQPQTPKPEEPKEEDNATETPASKPAGFKPRFKAGVTKNKPTDDNQSE